MWTNEGFRPEPVDEFYQEEQEEGRPAPMVLMPVFSGEEFIRQVCFPVVVEMWKHVEGRSVVGRVKRAYHKEFNEKERAAITRWHKKFERWHLVTGTPIRIMMRMKTLEFLKRVVDFFGTI